MSRTLAQREQLFRRLGVDLGLTFAGPSGMFDDADLATTRSTRGFTPDDDVAIVEAVDAARQMLVDRIMTRRGELAQLGHPEYGSRHHDLIGEPDTERTRNLVKLHILECLRHEPRIAKVVRCDIVPMARYRDVVRIVLDIRLVDAPQPLNLVVPFDLEGPA